MKKRQFAIALLFSIASSISLPAVAETPVVEFKMRNGEQIQVELEDKTRGLTRLNDNRDAILFYVITGASIYDENGNEMPNPNPDNEYQKPGKMLFEKNVSDMSSILFRRLAGVDSPVDNAKFSLSLSEGVLRVNGLTKHVEISVADPSGVLLDRFDVSGDTEIRLDRYGEGVRIINIDGETMKVLVK